MQHIQPQLLQLTKIRFMGVTEYLLPLRICLPSPDFFVSEYGNSLNHRSLNLPIGIFGGRLDDL